MAASVTISYGESRPGNRWVQWDWTSHTDGAVAAAGDTKALNGTVLRVVTDPGATAPSDNYDVLILDEHGLDIAAGFLANRDTANTEEVYPIVDVTSGATHYPASPVFDGKLTLDITNAGSAKQGSVRLYYR